MKNGQILFVLFLGILMILFGCSGNSDNNILSSAISQIDIKGNGHQEQLTEYDSPYTICYKNEDNSYTMYIFASPIQYKTEGTYKIINNTVIKSEKSGFAFENLANSIKTYFPKTLFKPFRVVKDNSFIEFTPKFDIKEFSEARQTIYTNMYGDRVSAVVYECKKIDLVFYPVKAGIKMEIVLKEKTNSSTFSFWVKTNAVSCKNEQNGYILFKNGGENSAIIYKPFIQYETDNGQQINVLAQLNIAREERDYLVTFTTDKEIINNPQIKFPVKLDPSFEMYISKMPDSTVYSEYNVNNYLAGYAILGEHSVLGEGWHYVRPRLNYLFGLQPNKVLSAYYSTYVYSSSKDNFSLSLYKLEKEWSSTRMLWSNKALSSDIHPFSNSTRIKNNFVSFDISQFTKLCFADSSFQTESNGFYIKCNNLGDGAIIATSDNSLYSPYFSLKLSSLPAYFEPKDNINPI